MVPVPQLLPDPPQFPTNSSPPPFFLSLLRIQIGIKKEQVPKK